ncbi:MAG: helix-turn-helix domain-containing protein [Acidobacteriota bacterium]|jgi:HTH-type transcriptional regulator/antitoxin HigA|nr:helix-turn-helix domain-containing protein [Acidobacteriota bacterium]
MQTVINDKKYGTLLTKVLPRRIETEEENDRYLAIVEKMIDKGAEKFSPEEDKLFDLLAILIEEFEKKAYPMPSVPANERLKYILEERGMKQKDLVPLFGSEGVVSEILSGKRLITLKTAKRLADFLQLSSYEILI